MPGGKRQLVSFFCFCFQNLQVANIRSAHRCRKFKAVFRKWEMLTHFLSVVLWWTASPCLCCLYLFQTSLFSSNSDLVWFSVQFVHNWTGGHLRLVFDWVKVRCTPFCVCPFLFFLFSFLFFLFRRKKLAKEIQFLKFDKLALWQQLC